MLRVLVSITFLLCLNCLRGASSECLGLQAFHAAGGRVLPAVLFRPADASATEEVLPTVIRLSTGEGASATSAQSPDVAAFLKQGCQVVCLFLDSPASGRVPAVNTLLAQLREALHRNTWLSEARVDKAHTWIVPAGTRLLREVPYLLQEQRSLFLDVLIPPAQGRPYGALLEFSCDNKDRMGNYSLHACSDTLLEGFLMEGHAVAMADHPVPPPYKGMDPMPYCGQAVRAALLTLRQVLASEGHNGRVVPVGFSRGSGMALLLATTAGDPQWNPSGFPVCADTSVQGAVILSGRFTYIDLLAGDHMLPRYDKAWGTQASNPEKWREQGAWDQWKGAPLPPLFLSINCTEADDALHQMYFLRRKLEASGTPHTFHMDWNARGHKVPLDSGVLQAIADYLRVRLN